jgi:membrane-bound lytic murein transglycosylase B
MVRCTAALLVFLCLAAGSANAAEPARGDYAQRADVKAFIEHVARRHGFDAQALEALFQGVRRQKSILKAIARPAEAKPWYQYRKIFLNPDRIQGGVRFWDEHADTIERASREYGVDPEIIVAIIGVETLYGKRTGRYPVLDALATLGFDYPKRGKFFRGELEQFLLLAREERMDPKAIKGSYAGAMGMGQFIPSSYRAYAVDFDGDGRRDLWDPEDAIGSVANYFKRHGWKAEAPVAVRARVQGEAFRKLPRKGSKPVVPVSMLASHGVRPVSGGLDGVSKVVFLEYDKGPARKEYWIGFDNFYVITRYNRSPLYAMAVYQLSREIADARAKAGRNGAR